MGFFNAAITVIVGYFAIDFVKKNKETLRDIPIINDMVKLDETTSISSDAYLILVILALKDFVF